MSGWTILRRIASYILYVSGLIGALTTAFGITQAIFTDKLIHVLELSGTPCAPGQEVLAHWETMASENAGQFVYLDVNLQEGSRCTDIPIGEYPFMSEPDGGSEFYTIPLNQPTASNYMPRLQIPVTDASEALLSEGFLDFYENGDLIGSGVFFVDLMNSGHAGPTYRFVPAPYSVETNQMKNCTASVYRASGLLARTSAFVKHCITSF